jgi:hypothetical protein
MLWEAVLAVIERDADALEARHAGDDAPDVSPAGFIFSRTEWVAEGSGGGYGEILRIEI